MRFAVYVFLLAACLGGLLRSGADLRYEVRLQSLLKDKQETGAELIAALRAVIGSGGADARSGGHLIAALNESALKAGRAEDKVRLFCEALGVTEGALREQPRNPRFLIAWANIRQVLGGAACAQKVSGSGFLPVIEYALRTSPNDVRSKLGASLLLVYAGRQAEAEALMHDVLTFGGAVQASEKEFIYSQVRDGESLSRIVPARFPQVIEVSRELKARDAGGVSAPGLKEMLARQQLMAIRESGESFSSKKIPLQLHFDRLSGLTALAASDEVRQGLDEELSTLYLKKGNSRAAEYLKMRSGLRERQIVVAAVASDTRPYKTSLANWGREDLVPFDEFYRSVGFYGRDETVQLIELHTVGESRELPASSIRVLHSEDNYNFEDIPPGGGIEQHALGGEVIAGLPVGQRRAKYWKVHFASAERINAFRNHLNALLRVYGP